MPELGGGGGEVIWAMPERNQFFLCDVFPNRGGVKKHNFFGEISPKYGWVGPHGGADSQTFGDIYQPLFFSTKVPKCEAVKTQNKI